MIELVVFDIAGTTVHDGDAVAGCFAAALEAAGVHRSRGEINSVMGLHKPEAIRHLLTMHWGSATGSEVDAIHADFVARMVRHYSTDPSVREIPGAGEVFARLRGRGIKVALDTGFGREIADVVLARLGWKDKIDASVCSDEVANGRPSPDMIRALMASLGVSEPQKVAKVGDTVSDLQEGTNAGCGLVIGVLSGSGTRKELAAQPHHHLVGSVAEVPALLG